MRLKCGRKGVVARRTQAAGVVARRKRKKDVDGSGVADRTIDVRRSRCRSDHCDVLRRRKAQGDRAKVA